eukprot:gene21140-21931_t
MFGLVENTKILKLKGSTLKGLSDILPRKVILAVYPSPVAYFNVPKQLCKYGIVTEEEQTHPEQMQKQGPNNGIAAAEEESDRWCDGDRLYSEVKDEFLDISPFNIHLRWKPTLIALLKAFHSYDPSLGLSEGLISSDMDEQEEEYLVRKR